MRELRARRRWALEALVERHQAALFGLALRMLGHRAAAEEVVVDCFLALWHGNAAPRPPGWEVRAWLLASVRDAAAQRLSPAQGEVTSPRPTPAPAPRGGDLPNDLTGADGSGHGIRAALGQLSPQQREAITLAYFGGLTVDAIAARLGISRADAMALLNGGVARLRASIASPLEEPTP